MAENGTTDAQTNLGQLGEIRNILMGPQMLAYEARFKTLEKLMASQADDMEKRFSDLEKSSQKALETLESGANSKFERLEKMVEKKLNQLSLKLDETSSKDKAKNWKNACGYGQETIGCVEKFNDNRT